MIELQSFQQRDFRRLIDEIPDARFLLQWAGPKYTFPLDAAQLNNTLANNRAGKPSFKVFKAGRPDTSETVGHIQLMDIDYNDASCILGRVLIFHKYRGTGLSKPMVRAAVRFAFENLKLEKITLGVFDFNTIAIRTYEDIGFSEFQFKKAARQFENESWDVVRMKLCKKSWLQRSPASHGIGSDTQPAACLSGRLLGEE